MNYRSMLDELVKIALITDEQARKSLERIYALEEARPTGGEVARGAIAGTAAGTLAQLAKGAVTGTLKSGIMEAAATGNTLPQKALRIGGAALKAVGGTAAGSAAFGASLPIIRQYLDRGAEEAKLREYVGQQNKGRLRSAVTKVVGVG